MQDVARRFADRSILIAGGTGFVGRRLAAKLLSAGARVTLLHRGRTALPSGCSSILADPWTPATLAVALKAHYFDGIFNLAAYGVAPTERDAAMMRNINVDCAEAILRHAIATRAPFLVHVGSCAEYAAREGREPLVETDSLETEKLYGVSKGVATSMLVSIANEAGLPCIVARLFGVYGPGEAAHRLLPSLWTKLSKAGRVPLSPGIQVRDLLHVDDATDGLLALASAVATTGRASVVNLCSGEGISVADFSRAVARAMGAPEGLLGFGDVALRPDDVLHLVGSTRLLRNWSDWRPQLSIDAGIEEAIAGLEQRNG